MPFTHSAESSFFAATDVRTTFYNHYVTSFDHEGKRTHFYHVRGATCKVTEGIGNSADIVPYPESRELTDEVIAALRIGKYYDPAFQRCDREDKHEDRFNNSTKLADKRKRIQAYATAQGILIAQCEEPQRFSRTDDIYHMDGRTVWVAGGSEWNNDSPRKLRITVLGNNNAKNLLDALYKL